MGFIIHFYIIFGTNLLTKGLVQIAVFCLFQCLAEKKYQTESKWNETFRRVIFGTNAVQETWSGRQGSNEAATRQGGTPRGVGAPPPSWAPCSSIVLLLPPIYISIYPKNIQEHHETLFQLLQPSVTVSSHLGAFSGAPPEGESIIEGFYINTIASPMKCE